VPASKKAGKRRHNKHGAPKRKSGDRYASGKLKALPQPHSDHGTDELQMRRITILESDAAALDPRTSFVWGILYARRLIVTHHYLAGLSLARDWHILYPHKTPPACLGNLIPIGEGTIAVPVEDACVPDTQGRLCGRCQACCSRRAKERYDEAEEAAQARSPRGWLMLKAALLFDAPPDFTDIDRRRAPSGTEYDVRDRRRLSEDWDRDERDHRALLNACEAILDTYSHRPTRDKDGREEIPVELRYGIEAMRRLRDERRKREAQDAAVAPKSDAELMRAAEEARTQALREARLQRQAEAYPIERLED
jgi:hypothetical protein